MATAAVDAGLRPRLDKLPRGIETMVGARGYQLSGGERQRLALARVLLADPPVLVLDEATSQLDSLTENVVQEALSRLGTGRTRVVIAHRLSTIVDATPSTSWTRARLSNGARTANCWRQGAPTPASTPGSWARSSPSAISDPGASATPGHRS